MKRILLALLILFAACKKEEPKGNLHIYGNVKGLKKGKIMISKAEDSSLVTIDSIMIDGDAEFASHLEIDSPQMLFLRLDRGVTTSIDDNLPVFAEPGELRIETTLNRFYADAKISGSANDSLYRQFRKINSRFTDQQLELTGSRLEAFRENKQFDDQAFIEKSNEITRRRYLHAINFAINHKDYEVAPYIAVTEIRLASLPLLDTVMNSLTPKVASSKYGRQLRSFIDERRKAELQP